MIIGLYDADMARYIHVPFSLELMKLSTYYKSQHDIVRATPYFEPEKYSKFIYWQDYLDEFQPDLTAYSNLTYGGLAFSDMLYNPLDVNIERLQPDKSIYNIYKNQFTKNHEYTTAWGVMNNALHFRLSLDGATIWNEFDKQFTIVPTTRTLFIHDFNVTAINQAEDIIYDLLAQMSLMHSGMRIAFKFPLQVYTEDELWRWAQFNPSSAYYPMQFIGVMDDAAIADFCEEFQRTAIGRQFIYMATGSSYDENEFIEKYLPRIYRQILYLRSAQIRFSLRYEENFFKDKRWEKLFALFNSFIAQGYNNKQIYYNSLYNFVKCFNKPASIFHRAISVDEARDLFNMVREASPETFEDFYKCKKVVCQGGKLINELYAN